MQRRDFIQISALSAAGLLAARLESQAATAYTRIAIVAGASPMSDERRPRIIESMAGAATMLRESGLPLDLVDQEVARAVIFQADRGGRVGAHHGLGFPWAAIETLSYPTGLEVVSRAHRARCRATASLLTACR